MIAIKIDDFSTWAREACGPRGPLLKPFLSSDLEKGFILPAAVQATSAEPFFLEETSPSSQEEPVTSVSVQLQPGAVRVTLQPVLGNLGWFETFIVLLQLILLRTYYGRALYQCHRSGGRRTT